VTLLERLSESSGLAVLVDPARTPPDNARELGERAAGEGVAVLLVGTSFGQGAEASATIAALRSSAPDVPLVLFPASASDLRAGVDGVLMLSLVSGRNAQYLIEEHVRAVPFLQRHPVATISTAYILIDGGRVTSVEAVSQTRPLPADKPELAAAHAKAAQLIGMQAIYLDAGSGAERPVPAAVVRAVRAAVPATTPLFVGGGITTPALARQARAAGADYVVIGTVLEREGAGAAGLDAFVRAVRE